MSIGCKWITKTNCEICKQCWAFQWKVPHWTLFGVQQWQNHERYLTFSPRLRFKIITRRSIWWDRDQNQRLSNLDLNKAFEWDKVYSLTFNRQRWAKEIQQNERSTEDRHNYVHFFLSCNPDCTDAKSECSRAKWLTAGYLGSHYISAHAARAPSS